MIAKWTGTQSERSPALFVYLPYCASVCTYCDFNVYARREREFDAYVNALRCEIEMCAQSVAPSRRATSLAFGGGTPSLLAVSHLQAIVETVRKHFAYDQRAEWTLEANPGTVDQEKLGALRAIGFNRLSLGVQTFDDARLRAFNRVHTVADAYNAFAWARRAGFENINLDLIYGLPDQTLDAWRTTLDRALAFESEHLSLYGLQVEERTVLKKQIDLGRVSMPDSDLAAQMYERAIEKLNDAGFVHYEISNWAKPGFESRHNKTYWLNEPYLGFGAGAHSSWQGERYENCKSPREYMRRLETGDSPIASREKISRAGEMSEVMFLGLRLAEGVTWARFRERFGVDAREIYREPIALLADGKLLVVDDERIRLTDQGMLVSNQILWRFLLDEA
ncbi:MAG: radical SAM family heme chaperone HemW [Chloroflexi bacterium]|nr:radical SAM family heme chaperone HemW [Chloroflexota bacterium]